MLGQPEAAGAGVAGPAPSPPPASSVGNSTEPDGCANWCSGHGTCEVDAGICHCDRGWTGADCNTQVVCMHDCNSPSGWCVEGVCVCEKGFSGPSCEERVREKPYVPDIQGAGGGAWTALVEEQDLRRRAERVDLREDGPDGNHPCLESDPFNPCGESDFLPVAARTPPPPTPPPTPHECANLCGRSKAPEQVAGHVTLSVTVQNVDYLSLTANAALTADFMRAAKEAVASRILRGAKSEDISVAIFPGSVVIQVTIVPDRGVNALTVLGQLSGHVNVPALQRAMAARLGKISSLQAVCTGVLTVGPISTPEVVSVSLDPYARDLQPIGCSDECSGHGRCAGGQCECIDGWSGDNCDIAACPGNCNARGTCLMGTCACNSMFFGEACEYVRCPNDCSGNGRCDKGTCRCNRGFQGIGCEVLMDDGASRAIGTARRLAIARAPVSPNAMGDALAEASKMRPPRCPEDCNGQGRCNQDGTCTCMWGYSGIACQNFCPKACSGNGECANGVCICMSGYSGSDCSVRTCCSGHGECPLPDACQCHPGWQGDKCQIQMMCPDPTCNSRGACKFGRCECVGGWSGFACTVPPEECPPCGPDGECDRITGLCMCGPAPCPGQQPRPQAAGAGPDTGLLGARSALHKASLALGLVTRHSQATSSAELPAVPNCHSPDQGSWSDSLGACVCNGFFYGKSCEQEHCADWDSNDPDSLECSGRGVCVEGRCLCAAGWGKLPGTLGSNICAEKVCLVDCGEHGLCQDNLCVCQEGWQGPACRQPKCINDCSGHGECTFLGANSHAECVCQEGWALPDCGQSALYQLLPACPNECSGNGLCFKGECVCSGNFAGIDCSMAQCPEGRSGPGCAFAACPHDCDGKGICLSGQCMCDQGHAGPDCSIPEACMDPCREICLADLTSEHCEICKGQCLTLLRNPVLGHHDPLAERLSTLAVGARARARPGAAASARLGLRRAGAGHPLARWDRGTAWPAQHRPTQQWRQRPTQLWAQPKAARRVAEATRLVTLDGEDEDA